MNPVEQRAVSLAAATEQRRRLAALRRDLRSGAVTLSEVVVTQPSAVSGMSLLDLVCMTRVRSRRGATLTRLGREAVKADVNLLMPVGQASARSRAWVAENAQFWMRVA